MVLQAYSPSPWEVGQGDWLKFRISLVYIVRLCKKKKAKIKDVDFRGGLVSLLFVTLPHCRIYHIPDFCSVNVWCVHPPCPILPNSATIRHVNTYTQVPVYEFEIYTPLVDNHCRIWSDFMDQVLSDLVLYFRYNRFEVFNTGQWIEDEHIDLFLCFFFISMSLIDIAVTEIGLFYKLVYEQFSLGIGSVGGSG